MRRRGCQAEEEEARNKDDSRPKLLAKKEEKTSAKHHFDARSLDKQKQRLLLYDSSLSKVTILESLSVLRRREGSGYTLAKRRKDGWRFPTQQERRKRRRRRGRKIAPIYVRKDGKEARRKLKVENERERRKDFTFSRFPRKRAMLFIDKKILSFALTFHDYFPEKPQVLNLGIGLKHLGFFFCSSQKFHRKMKKCIYFPGFFSGKDEEAP